MDRFDGRHDAANQVKKTPLFGNPSYHPVVPVADEDVLESRMAPGSDRGYLDYRAQPLRAIVAGELPERRLDLLNVRKHMPLNHYLGVRRHHEILSPSLRGCKPERLSHDGADAGIVIDTERRDIQRTEIEGRVMAHHNSYRSGTLLLLVLPVDLPVVPGRHVNAQPPWPLDHIAEKGHVIEALLRVFHHRGHVDVRGRVHSVMTHNRELVKIRIFPPFNDFFNRGFFGRDGHWRNKLFLSSSVLQAQRKSGIFRAHPQRQGATPPGGKNVA